MEDTLVIHSEKRTPVKTLDARMSNVSLYISLTLHFMFVLLFAFSGGFNDNEQHASLQAPPQMNIVQANLWTPPVKKSKKIIPETSSPSYESIVENTSLTGPLPQNMTPSIEQAKKKV
jgi:hypothetical protein